jgi:hypothetical protein
MLLIKYVIMFAKYVVFFRLETYQINTSRKNVTIKTIQWIYVLKIKKNSLTKFKVDNSYLSY